MIKKTLEKLTTIGLFLLATALCSLAVQISVPVINIMLFTASIFVLFAALGKIDKLLNLGKYNKSDDNEQE